MNDLILIGKVVKAYGIKGRLKVRPFTEPVFFIKAKGVYLGREKNDARYYRMIAFQDQKGSVVIAVEGIESMNKAEEFVGSYVYAERNAFEILPEGEYYYFEIIGLDVLTDDGRHLGKVKEIFPTGSNDVYVVEDKGREYLIPAIEDVIKKIDLADGKVVISPIEGLLGEE